MGVLELYIVSKMFFALFLYNESVMISSLAYNVFIHIKYKFSHIKKMLWHNIRQVFMHS